MASADRRTFKRYPKRRHNFLSFCSATKIRVYTIGTRLGETISIVCQFAMRFCLLFVLFFAQNTYLLNGIYAVLHGVERNGSKKDVYELNFF